MGPHTIDTASGRKIDLDDPNASEIALDDIAGGLSRICRFGAQSVRFHSVAEHAVLVSRLVVDEGHPELALAALHHDSHEAYVCDIPAPLKRKMQREHERVYDSVCDALDEAIFTALGIEQPSAAGQAIIKAADKHALMLEAADLLPDHGAGIRAATRLPLEAPGRLGTSLDPDRARQEFLHVHEDLAHGAAGSAVGTTGAAARARR